VVVKIMANGICGSDLHFYHEGRLGAFIVKEPYIPGHEASGVIVATGSGVGGVSVNDNVVIEPGMPCRRCIYCQKGRYNLCDDVVFLSEPPVNGTFCDYIAVKADVIYPMPKKMSYEQGALVEPASVAVHAVNRARMRNGDTALVIGAGPIGLMTIQAFKAAGGTRVTSLDPIDKRRKIALELGADNAIDPNSLGKNFSSVADIIFETAGSTAATASLFKYARKGGKVIQIGWPADITVNMNIAEYMEKELEYSAVFRYANAFPAAIAWISDGRIKVEEMITHRFPLDHIEEAFQFTINHRDEVIKTIVMND
jgi:L-iditol 2-dehydrogenase